MASLKLSEEDLLPLTSLTDKVDRFAALCDPDYVCLPDTELKVVWRGKDYDADDSEIVGLDVVTVIEDKEHLFTDWSRPQLLSHLGCREKWFEPVDVEQQAAELNRRIHTLAGYRLRRMRTNTEGISLLRGLVSKHYTEIPDTSIMQALNATLPEGKCVLKYSGKTDKSFYGYVLSGDPVGSKANPMLPGAVFKNSEVGAGSLSITPFLLLNSNLEMIILKKDLLLRRAHRGGLKEMKEAFADALGKLGDVWGPLTTKMNALSERTFPDELEALEKMRLILVGLKATKGVISECCKTYQAAKHVRHSARTIFEAVLQAAPATQRDLAYEKAELAGHFLYCLL